MKNNQTKFKETEIGFIPEEWDIDVLGNHAVLLGGKRLSKEDSLVEYKTAHPYIRITDFSEHGVDEQKVKFITEEVHQKIKKYIIEAGDVYISNVGTVGLVGIVKDNLSGANLTENAVRITKLNSIDNYFLYYYLKSQLGQDQISQNTVGAVQPKLPIYGINNIKIILPKLSEQRQIAEIISALDDKIELNRKINVNLEKTASMLFKQWFVDFEFPNGNGKPYKSSGGKVIESELGEIPERWSVSKLEDYVSLDRGLSYKGKHLCDDGIPMLNLGTFDISGGMKFSGLKYYDGEYKDKNMVHPGDIVIANTDITQSRDVLGSAVMVADNFSVQDILFTHHVYAVRFLKEISHQFIYSLLTTSDFKSNVITYATGTTVLFLPKDGVLDYRFCLPNEGVQENFENIANDIRKKIEINNEEISVLAKLRDALLPRLMSGKIRVVN